MTARKPQAAIAGMVRKPSARTSAALHGASLLHDVAAASEGTFWTATCHRLMPSPTSA